MAGPIAFRCLLSGSATKPRQTGDHQLGGFRGVLIVLLSADCDSRRSRMIEPALLIEELVCEVMM